MKKTINTYYVDSLFLDVMDVYMGLNYYKMFAKASFALETL